MKIAVEPCGFSSYFLLEVVPKETWACNDLETGWDLGPGTLCCRAFTWANISMSNKLQINYQYIIINI